MTRSSAYGMTLAENWKKEIPSLSHLIFVHIFIHFKYMDGQLVWPGYLAVWRENTDFNGDSKIRAIITITKISQSKYLKSSQI